MIETISPAAVLALLEFRVLSASVILSIPQGAASWRADAYAELINNSLIEDQSDEIGITNYRITERGAVHTEYLIYAALPVLTSIWMHE